MDERRWRAAVSKLEALATDAVLEAAALLDVTEFDFFRLAYRRRFGRQPAERMLEAVFADYMLRADAPPWVTGLAREVLHRRDRGALDAEAIGAGRFRDRPARPPHGALWISAAVTVWLVLMVCLLDLRGNPQAAECRTGGFFFHDWVAMISGRPRCGP